MFIKSSMLRRIRIRLNSADSPRRISSSAAFAHALDEEHRVPYGVAYGAGPSRIPYRPPSRSFIGRAQGHEAARVLREKLSTLSHGSYAAPQAFVASLLRSIKGTAEKTQVRTNEVVPSLSRLELHTIVHHLIQEKKGNLASAIVLQALQGAPRMARRRVVSPKTLRILFGNRSIFHMRKASSKHRAIVPNLQPTIAEQRSPPPAPRLQTLLDILDILQDVRYPRTPELYELIISSCCDEGQPHLAAKIYTGLVEEWVTEGRVAEGANPEEFHPGGGPPRGWKKGDGGRWWTGVRTWRWPGEVLSPHDRLDLWHPRHLALPEKMRNFPVPLATSPPSVVPAPHSSLLNNIVNSLQLDPSKTSPHEFASSMRALAILANTVLSRTLPILALGPLLKACHTAPFKPDVYPESMADKPEQDEWAYTAFTQMHVMLMSLLWSPPISAESMRLIAAAQNAERATTPGLPIPESKETSVAVAPPPTLPLDSPYKLPPLTLSSCGILLSYAFRILKAPNMLNALMLYMKSVFKLGKGSPSTWNIILGGASRLKENKLADDAGKMLFGNLGDVGRMDKREFFSKSKVETVGNKVQFDLALSNKDGEQDAGPEANESSLVALISHLTASSQFSRLTSLVYTLIPYLAHSRGPTTTPSPDDFESQAIEFGENGRPKSVRLTPDIWVALLRGMEKAGKTGLGQRLYNVGLYEEGVAWKEMEEEHPELSALPSSLRLPQEFFTTVLLLFSQHSFFPSSGKASIIKGLCLPRGSERLTPGLAVGFLGIKVHESVKGRWEDGWVDESEMEGAKGQKYFEALIKCCWKRWGLDMPEKPLREDVGKEIVGVMKDMEAWAVQVPEVLVARFKGIRVDVRDGFWGIEEMKWGGKMESKKEAANLLKRMMGE